MKYRKWYRRLTIVMAVMLLVGCGKQEIEQNISQETSIRKIMDISVVRDELLEGWREGGTGQMVFDNLTVTMNFPDGWTVDDIHDKDVDYQSIDGYEVTKSLNMRAEDIDKKSVEISIDDKIGDSMDAEETSKKMEKYIKESITYETSNYKSMSQFVWQNPTYETVTINGQKYIKASGVTKTKKDAGDAHIGYFTIVNGVILKFVFDTEAATIDQATQSTFDNIMNSVTYTY